MGLIEFKKVRGSYGGPWAKKLDLPVTPEMLREIGKCLVEHFAREALKDFAKRGWSVRDPKGGPDIGDSFSYQIRGMSTVEITSTFYGMDVLGSQDVPERRMTWLTQEGKDAAPQNYKRTNGERNARAKSGTISRGGRLPLVVPIKTDNGKVIFRTAPLKLNEAWVHPGIAKFTFVQRAMDKGRKSCLEIVVRRMGELLMKGTTQT